MAQNDIDFCPGPTFGPHGDPRGPRGSPATGPDFDPLRRPPRACYTGGMEEQTVPAAVTVVEEFLMCCGKGKCPRVKLFSDGSVAVDDPDAGVAPVLFTAEQAKQLRAELERRGY